MSNSIFPFYAMPVRIVNARACGRGGIKFTNIAVTGIHAMEKVFFITKTDHPCMAWGVKFMS